MELDWRSIAGAVAPYAPKLGTVLGGSFGPLGGLIGGFAGNAIAVAFGVPPTPEAVGKAITDDPEAADKLQKLEEERGEAILAQANAEIEKVKQVVAALGVDAADRADARDTAVKMVGTPLSKIQAGLAVSFTVGFFILLFMFLWRNVTVSEAALLMLGVLTGSVKDIISFFFGSSAGSQSKEAILGGVVATAQENTAKAMSNGKKKG